MFLTDYNDRHERLPESGFILKSSPRIKLFISSSCIVSPLLFSEYSTNDRASDVPRSSPRRMAGIEV